MGQCGSSYGIEQYILYAFTDPDFFFFQNLKLIFKDREELFVKGSSIK